MTFVISEAWRALISVARMFFSFLMKPQIPIGRYDQLPSSPLVVGISLFALSIAVTAAFAAAALPLMLMVEATPGSQLQQVFSRSLPSVVVAVVVLGPLIEEVMFRGWLSGTWRSVIGSAFFLTLVFGITPLIGGLFSVSPVVIQFALAAVGLVGLGLWAPIDSGMRLPYFERAFPFIFWAQGVLFGVLHFQNVSASSPLVAGFATLPLVFCAWLWGFARIYIGLSGAVLLHAAYNVPAVAGMLAFGMLQRS